MLELTAASSPSERQTQARYLLQCVWTMTTWVHRRVETVSFRDDRWAVRRVSVDFTVPSDERAPGGAGPMLVPLTFLRQRQPLRNFDCRDRAGNALPVLTRAENARVHRDMLLEAAGLALGYLDETVVAAVAAQARRRVTEPATLAPEVAGAVEALGASPQFALVNELLRDQFLLLAWMNVSPGDRTLAKFCYDEELPFGSRGRRRDVFALMGWRNETVEFPARAAAFSQSYHFAVNPPPEVVVDSTDLVETVRPDQVGLPEPEVWGEPGHLVASGLTMGLETNVLLELGARTDGWLQTAVASAWATVTILLAGAWGFFLESPSDAASALVVGLAVFLPAVVARPGEHALAARLLSGVRLMLALLAVLAVVAGARLAFFDPGGVDAWWLALGLLGLVPASALSASYGHARRVMARRRDATDPGVRYLREVRDGRGPTHRD